VAELIAFGYLPGDSPVHRLDVRVKVLGMVVLSIAGLKAQPLGLLILSLALGTMMMAQKLPLRTLLRQLRLFGVLLLLVWVSRALTTPGIPWIDWGPFQISKAGAIEGGLMCYRLVLTLAAGLIFTAATRPGDLKAAVYWIFKWIPGFPAQRLAVMASLVMGFFPLILGTAQEIRRAQLARGIQNRKNPFYHILKLSVPLLRKTFQSADELATAMEARCYTSRPTPPGFSFQPRDGWALALLAGLLVPVLAL
jgi:energy-coupling factor transporter transmembrane protein EcfT